MMYSHYDKNSIKDDLYTTRLRCFKKLGLNEEKKSLRAYYHDADYGYIFTEQPKETKANIFAMVKTLKKEKQK